MGAQMLYTRPESFLTWRSREFAERESRDTERVDRTDDIKAKKKKIGMRRCLLGDKGYDRRM
jgi:hypothetical protein